jgi:uncharacterized protein YutE (UPF0331/DUF86 family)
MGAVGKLYELTLEYTEKLDELSKRDLGDWVVFYSALYLLQSQAQALIDLFLRACSLKGLLDKGLAKTIIEEAYQDCEDP